MSKPFKLSELDQFIGTQRYYRMSSRVVLTDGTHYLAERVGCYWLMDVIASYLIEARIQDWFVLATLDVQQSEGLVRLEDGNGNCHVSQAIPHTDFFLCTDSYLCCVGRRRLGADVAFGILTHNLREKRHVVPRPSQATFVFSLGRHPRWHRPRSGHRCCLTSKIIWCTCCARDRR